MRGLGPPWGGRPGLPGTPGGGPGGPGWRGMPGGGPGGPENPGGLGGRGKNCDGSCRVLVFGVEIGGGPVEGPFGADSTAPNISCSNLGT